MADVEGEAAKASVAGAPDGSGITIVSIGGEIDMATVPGVEVDLEQFLVPVPERLVFDLSGVTFMDSSGIAMLLRAAERVGVEVRDPSPSVKLILEATGLTEFLRVQS